MAGYISFSVVVTALLFHYYVLVTHAQSSLFTVPKYGSTMTFTSTASYNWSRTLWLGDALRSNSPIASCTPANTTAVNSNVSYSGNGTSNLGTFTFQSQEYSYTLNLGLTAEIYQASGTFVINGTDTINVVYRGNSTATSTNNGTDAVISVEQFGKVIGGSGKFSNALGAMYQTGWTFYAPRPGLLPSSPFFSQSGQALCTLSILLP